MSEATTQDKFSGVLHGVLKWDDVEALRLYFLLTFVPCGKSNLKFGVRWLQGVLCSKA